MLIYLTKSQNKYVDVCCCFMIKCEIVLPVEMSTGVCMPEQVCNEKKT